MATHELYYRFDQQRTVIIYVESDPLSVRDWKSEGEWERNTKCKRTINWIANSETTHRTCRNELKKNYYDDGVEKPNNRNKNMITERRFIIWIKFINQ